MAIAEEEATMQRTTVQKMASAVRRRTVQSDQDRQRLRELNTDRLGVEPSCQMKSVNAFENKMQDNTPKK
jgi:hypothetical protein